VRELVRKRSRAAVEPLNPQFHDEFVALSALYYSGEISEEEWALLQIHMGYCDACHERFLEYQQVASGAIPALAAAAASEIGNQPRESAESLEAAERRLMSRLDSLPAGKEPRRAPKWGRHLGTALIAACGLGLACMFGFEIARMKPQTDAQRNQALPHSAQVQATNGGTARDQALERSQEQIASLQQQVSAAAGRLKQANLVTSRIETQLSAEQSAYAQLSEEKDQAIQKLASVQTELDSLRNKWATAGTDTAQQETEMSALGEQVRELKASLEEKDVELSEKDRMLSLDKDFLAHDRDIRDLIGARNLYIADIFDTTENGKTAKQFGRIFYTKDRSLIFYGFDLDSQAGRTRDVSFQVWGSGSDRPTPVSLGLFYQDDTHKRWVLRCNDPKTLARLDMVFVTVEPSGGSSRPTGKQLLRAYLQIHPNHP